MIDLLGIGARTPVGLTAPASAAAIRAGISRLREFPFATMRGEPLIIGADARLKDALQGPARMVELATSAVAEALADFAPGAVPECELWLALPEQRPGFDDHAAATVARASADAARQRGFRTRATLGGRGHAGVMQCVQRILAATDAERLHVVVGVDSYCDDECLVWLEQARRLAQDGVRGGFTPGEAAGCLVLGRRRLGALLERRPLATISGAGVHQETQLRDSDAGSFGLALSEAVMDAAAGLDLPAHAADAVYCDINGERYRSEEWGLFATRAHAALRSLQYQTFCGSIGDVGAAFGAIASIAAAQSFARGYARGPRALVMAGSDSGTRGAMFLHDPRLEGRP